MIEKPRLLFLTPVAPAVTGHGAAMRAGSMLEALSINYQVVVLLVPLWSGKELADARLLDRCCAAFQVLPKQVVHESIRTKQAIQLSIAQRIHHIHIFRLVLAPLIRPYLGQSSQNGAFCTLDLDDYESKKNHRIAELVRGNCGREAAAPFLARAAAYAEVESAYLPLFDRVLVPQPEDRAELHVRYGCRETCVVPNAIRVAHRSCPEMRREPDGPFTFVFVGHLGYYPNQDAVIWFCTLVLPRIRERTGADIRVLVIGPDASAEVKSLAQVPGGEVVGRVDDLAPHYARAHAAIAPLRAGGGTRIKILEALAHRVPMIATSLGAEGLTAKNGDHLLIADGVEGFTDAAVTLAREPALRKTLSERGYSWVVGNHTQGCVNERMRELSLSARPAGVSTGVVVDRLEAPGVGSFMFFV
jgi:glycosyltransferase involved in cell wall biosynthesis